MQTNLPDNQKPSSSGSRRGFYLLPNLFTTVGLFAGFYSVVAALKGLYDASVIAVYVAMLADSLDGKVARLTNTQSAFGAEYDSLSDMVAFGIAPSLVAYSLILHGLGKLGWLAAFCYTAATALRLARFNVAAAEDDSDKRYFYGLPSPAAAGLVTGVVWVNHLLNIENHIMRGIMAVVLVVIAGLMVSNIRYLSFKDLDLKGSVPFFILLIFVLIVVAIALDPPHVLFAGFFVYALSGPLMALYRWITRNKKKTSL